MRSKVMKRALHLSLLSIAWLLVDAQPREFDNFIPSTFLHWYYSNGAIGQIRFNGRPLADGMSIVVFGVLDGHGDDSKGTYLDLEGIPSIGRSNGVVRIYIPTSEVDKLQSATYYYESMDQRKPITREVAVRATLAGLNRYDNLQMTNGSILPWQAVLLPPWSRAQLQGNKEEADAGLRGLTRPVTTLPSGLPLVQSKPLVSFLYPVQEVRIAPKVSSIREVDFSNFSYLSVNPGFISSHPAFTLAAGKNTKRDQDESGIMLGPVQYGNVTGDRSEQAIVVLSVRGGGSGTWNFVYIYGMREDLIVLLACFETGDRADRGLRRIATEPGTLILDLNELGTGGLCCPAAFTRTRYKWSAGRFVQIGEVGRHVLK
jgi:hypothetical protein